MASLLYSISRVEKTIAVSTCKQVLQKSSDLRFTE